MAVIWDGLEGIVWVISVALGETVGIFFRFFFSLFRFLGYLRRLFDLGLTRHGEWEGGLGNLV